MPDDNNDEAALNPEVGYRKPPRRHSFKKGETGNPLGRPRKQHEVGPPGAVDRAYLTEASRKFRVRDENGVQDLPAIHVAIRTQAMAAARGDPRAQRDFAENTRRAERAEMARTETFFEAAVDYKALCEEIQDSYKARRLPPPEFEIDPDDLVLNVQSRTVTFSIAARNKACAASRKLRDLRRELNRELALLTILLTDEPDSALIKCDIEFLKTLSKRLC
jgi:hypothetical protein